MSINCKKTLKNKHIANESRKDSATRIATIAIILTIICSIEYCAIVIVLLLYNQII